MTGTSKPRGAVLPQRASELIRVAIRDLRSIERSKAYRVDMTLWHSVGSRQRSCAVCLGGAVMARTFGADRESTLVPEDVAISHWDTARLYALDSLRLGVVDHALVDDMGLDAEHVRRRLARLPAGSLADGYWRVPRYADEPKEFKRSMLAMADALEGVGL